ncbi:MAG: hypothetical protein HOM58_19345 [Rhodospirillaceae bacterium]|jgi:hypothetical protein|nr:hypothetical protein [Rhodospirillaceae bacterium]MBT5457051.1 hypothetical protein [Rhodospirillaceae bacterium]
MTASFDLDFITFRCEHSKCREVFEKSPKDLADDEVICPRCGTAATMGDDIRHVVTARVSDKGPYMEKTR